MTEWLTSFAVTETLGTIGSYLLAGAFVAGGVYLAGFAEISDKSVFYPFVRPIKYVGLGLAAFGIVLASAAYFKHIGAADCIAASRVADLQQENASLKRDLEAQRAATKAKEDEAAKLAAQQRDADDQIASWQSYAANLSTAVAACRRATPDDDARLCKLLGNAPAGCRAAR